MTMPRFFGRVADAIGPIAGLAPEALAERLTQVTLHIHGVDADPARERASLLLVNLAARLYPSVRLVGPDGWRTAAADLAQRINPKIELVYDEVSLARRDINIGWDKPGSNDSVGIGADGWTAFIDPEVSTAGAPTHPLAAAAAAALGMGEVFRIVFADALGDRGRRQRQAGALNLITGTDQPQPLNSVERSLPPATLVGAGAVGQACLWALIGADVDANITVVDPETITLSNLQRYLLTDDNSPGDLKTAIGHAAAAGSRVNVTEVSTPWAWDGRSGVGAPIVLTALDSAADRIAVAASLPRRAYNAWTQPADVGWSRHEEFGVEPCLACLYYPTQLRPNDHELIAAALNQHPLRALTYLVTGVPIGQPLPVIAGVPDLPAPLDAPQWLQTPLIDDLMKLGIVAEADRARWATLPLGQVYRDGVCAGGLVRLPELNQPEAALVPLAHQSALAGIMLATEYLVAAQPGLLLERRRQIEGRFDVLRGFPQYVGRPRARTRDCLCSDQVYLAHAERQVSGN